MVVSIATWYLTLGYHLSGTRIVTDVNGDLSNHKMPPAVCGQKVAKYPWDECSGCF